MIDWPWDQLGILVVGLPALWLTTYRQFHVRRWAYILGLVSEVFWIWTCVVHKQWWILGSVAAYTFVWGRGFWEHWMKEQRNG